METDASKESGKSSAVALEGCEEQMAMQLLASDETKAVVALPACDQSQNQEVTDTSDDDQRGDSPHFAGAEDGAVGGSEEQSKAVQPSKGSSADLLQLAEQAFGDQQESGTTLVQLSQVRPRLRDMIQFAIDQRYPGPSGNGGQTVAADRSVPTNSSNVDAIIVQALQTMDSVSSLGRDLESKLHDERSRKKISLAQERKKKMDLQKVSDLRTRWRDLVSITRTTLTSIDAFESDEDKDQDVSSESDNEESTDSNKEMASDADDGGSATFALQLDKEKVSAEDVVKEKTETLFPLPAVSCLPMTTVGYTVMPYPVADKQKLGLNSDHADLEEEGNNGKIKTSLSAQDMSNPQPKEMSKDQSKEDGDFEKEFQNIHPPGSSSQQGHSLPLYVFHHDSARHETPATSSLQTGPYKSYEELHFGRPPEERTDDSVAQENKAEAATQTSEEDFLGRCSNGPVKIPCGASADCTSQPSEEEGAVGGAVCPSGQGSSGGNDLGIPDPTCNQTHSMLGEQRSREAIGELMAELQPQDEEVTVSTQFTQFYGPPAIMHLEDESYPRRNLFDFQDHEELYDLSSADSSPPPSLDLEELLTEFRDQGARVVIVDSDGHTLLNTLLAGPRLVQYQALEIATTVLERGDLRDFTLRWPGGYLIPWDSLLGLPSNQGPTTVQVQPAQHGEGEWRVVSTEGDPILQPPDNQEENAGNSEMQACLSEGLHGQQQLHGGASSPQSSHAGPGQPLTVQPDTAEQQDFRCTICKEGRGQLVETPCQHLFHPGCLYNWIARNDSCPNCRKPVNKCSEN
ncbi:PREDICTED: uncharacterized protein LOC109484899 [Branchiostoma belcheri]|uniref:Uncharacterized protein LOC109484899 n=1 Tax=Branchiostoma belcheri TaxID=7741 RepID=A0A6P5AL53_BRABE|nr:PREDICTED: uncharacterized protein LOC109484899 [Branchiostoma belcheri]